MECPKCGSDNFQTKEMIYKSGRQDISAVSITGNTKGGHSLTPAMGTSSTLLSSEMRPPVKKAFMGGCLMLVGGMPLVAALMAAVTGGIYPMLLVIIALSASAVFLGWKSIEKDKEYNETIYPELYNEWASTWVCLRCGNSWTE